MRTARARMRRAMFVVLLWWVLATGPQPLALERKRVAPPRRTHRAALEPSRPVVAARRRGEAGAPRRARGRSA